MSNYDVKQEVTDKYSLRGRVFHKIREDILSGHYKEHEELKEVVNLVIDNATKIEVSSFLSKDDGWLTVNDVVKNINGEVYNENDDVKEILKNHIISPVKFSKSLQYMIDNGVDTFIEIGPGKTLSGFVKRMKTDNPINILNINDIKTFNQAIEFLNK